MPVVAWSPCPHPRSASTRPVSGVQCPRVRCPRVRCPMSGVSGCPGVRVSGCPGVHCPGVSPASVSARSASPSASAVSAPVTSWSVSVRRTVTRPGHGAGRPAVPANGSGNGRSQSRAAAPVQAVLGQRRRRAGPGRRRGGARAAGRFDRLAGRGPPVAQDRPSVWEQVCVLCTQAVAWRRAGRQGQGWRHAADHDLGWTATATRSGLGVVDLGPGSPAPAGSLARRVRRLCGPTAAQVGRERDRVGRGSPLSWENSGGPART